MLPVIARRLTAIISTRLYFAVVKEAMRCLSLMRTFGTLCVRWLVHGDALVHRAFSAVNYKSVPLGTMNSASACLKTS
jgi:hypothetical protein